MYSRIIEPFAGSARYSVYWSGRRVWINDIDKTVFRVWRYIRANKERLLNLEDITPGEDIRLRGLSYSATKLLGYIAGVSSYEPRHTVSQKSAGFYQGVRVQNSSLSHFKAILEKTDISHWTITHRNYLDLPNVEATWFIDPPYQGAGHRYKHHDIDYQELKEWCTLRRGQVIVCENIDADWLRFRPLCVTNGMRYSEVLSA